MTQIISGTNRPGSRSLQLAHYYQSVLAQMGHTSEVFSLEQLPENFLNEALYHKAAQHPTFAAIREKMLETSRFVFIVPEYNGSFPGALKAFIDGLKYPDTFQGKVGALVGHSKGVQGASLALSHLDDVLSYMQMNTLGLRIKIPQSDQAFVDGALTNPAQAAMLEKQARQLIESPVFVPQLA